MGVHRVQDPKKHPPPDTRAPLSTAKMVTNSSSSPKMTNLTKNSLKFDEIFVKFAIFFMKIVKILRNFENQGREKNVELVYSYVSHIFFHSFSVPTDASRSRQALSNEYLVVKICFDEAENGPHKV